MSSIYITEPSTSGKVLLKTTFGDIDIELWAREAPKACRNFVQLCLEGFYNNNLFHRVVKDFIAQTGDPTGTGTYSESIYGAPFKDEIHTRLRFNRRGLVALANGGKDDNGSQFFITLNATPELQGKHTIFGKIAGDTVYNVLKLNDIDVEEEDRPVYEQKILKTVVLNNPFEDIVPRVDKQKEQKAESKKEKKEKGVKNFKLLSFGDEAEEDEMETTIENKKFGGKSKSTHDVLNDPKLSRKTVYEEGKDENADSSDSDKGDERIDKKQLENIKNKLKRGLEQNEKPAESKEVDESDGEFMSSIKLEKKKKLDGIKKEIKNLKRENYEKKKEKIKEEESKEKKKTIQSEVLDTQLKLQEKYKSLKQKLPAKGASREEFTNSLLKKFKTKLISVKEDSTLDTIATAATTTNTPTKNKNADDEDDNSKKWLACKLEGSSAEVLAKDANLKDDDWFEIYDPRNPITKRRRENSKQQLLEKRKSKYYS